MGCATAWWRCAGGASTRTAAALATFCGSEKTGSRTSAGRRRSKRRRRPSSKASSIGLAPKPPKLPRRRANKRRSTSSTRSAWRWTSRWGLALGTRARWHCGSRNRRRARSVRSSSKRRVLGTKRAPRSSQISTLRSSAACAALWSDRTARANQLCSSRSRGTSASWKGHARRGKASRSASSTRISRRSCRSSRRGSSTCAAQPSPLACLR
mmetsp:Transcript_11356/g.37274  ORF Transcript_11356/g.37274 Transcript_11356/m.37274 type:complete len:211 (-) Transcript_11356:839-1471(-)